MIGELARQMKTFIMKLIFNNHLSNSKPAFHF